MARRQSINSNLPFPLLLLYFKLEGAITKLTAIATTTTTTSTINDNNNVAVLHGVDEQAGHLLITKRLKTMVLFKQNVKEIKGPLADLLNAGGQILRAF
jgi:hypothetical protein